MADERSFPDVEFVETDTAAIAKELTEAYEEAFDRTLAPGDPVKQFILWLASILSQERSYINIAAKRNLPRYAEGEYLDSLSEIFYGVSREEASPAYVVLRFMLDEAVDEDILIPEGTEATQDGNLVFATNTEAVIHAGELFVDVTAECETEGTVGNGFAPGSITSLLEDIPYVSGVTNVTESVDGTDEGSDDELYNRGRESYEGYATTGTAGAYKYHVMQHNNAVSDALVRMLEPGRVGITILMDDGIPSAETVAEMQEYISSDEIRTLTDTIEVSGAEAVPYSIELTYWGAATPAVGGEELDTLVNQATQEYIDWQKAKLGRRINPSKLIAYIIRAGADRVSIISPTEQKLSATQCAELTGEPILRYGGEDV